MDNRITFKKTQEVHLSILYYGTPVILLNTLNEDNSTNITPMSSSWALGDRIVLGLSVNGKAIENLKRHPECVVNVPNPSLWKNVEALAISLFAEKGYSNTATAEIAKLAGVAEGTIFKHYGTKENLLLSIMVPFLKELFPSMVDELFEELITDNISFEEFLRTFLKNRMNFLLENQEIFQVFIKEIIYKEELKNELLPYILEQTSPRIGKVIEIFQKRGKVIDLPIAQIINVLATTLSGFFISRFVLLNLQLEIDHIVHFFCKWDWEAFLIPDLPLVLNFLNSDTTPL